MPAEPRMFQRVGELRAQVVEPVLDARGRRRRHLDVSHGPLPRRVVACQASPAGDTAKPTKGPAPRLRGPAWIPGRRRSGPGRRTGSATPPGRVATARGRAPRPGRRSGRRRGAAVHHQRRAADEVRRGLGRRPRGCAGTDAVGSDRPGRVTVQARSVSSQTRHSGARSVAGWPRWCIRCRNTVSTSSTPSVATAAATSVVRPAAPSRSKVWTVVSWSWRRRQKPRPRHRTRSSSRVVPGRWCGAPRRGPPPWRRTSRPPPRPP